MTTLRRELGLFSAALLVVGGIIGSGIFFTPAETARNLPIGAWVLGVWTLGGVVALAGALTYAELGAMLPEAGGAYVYVREAFGKLPAFLLGWMTLLMIASGAIAAVAMGFAGYLERFVPLDAVGGRIGVAAATIVLLTVTNYLGVKPGTVTANVFTLSKIFALGALIVVGAVVAVGAPAPVAAAPVAPPLANGFAAAFVAVLFTIGGWQQTNMVAGEIRDPARTLPRALFIGIAIVIAIYLGANVVYLKALGRDGVAASQAVAADAAGRFIGARGATAITLAAMLSIFGFVNVALLTNARVLYALGKDGAFVASAAKVHPRFGSPHVALLMLGGWSLVLLFATRGAIGTLLSGVVFADWIFFGLGAASVFVLRRTHPEWSRPYRVLGYPWMPAFFVACAVVGIVSAYVSALRMSLVGTAMLAVGLVVYRFTGRR
ncbi:MAG: amino acid permease [Gemmatimonadetes bacterium]|nr:amino acid permease [Gemmatimonadota bacterium]MBI3569085.1 amino acid permease [Gemmatimonadota bacterium]